MSQLQALPPFITDPFALKILLDLGGKASTNAIKEHVIRNYDTSKFPHAIQYLMTQYGGLRAAGYVENRAVKGEVQLWICADALEIAKNMVKEAFGPKARR